jgi:hypothetical protein
LLIYYRYPAIVCCIYPACNGKIFRVAEINEIIIRHSYLIIDSIEIVSAIFIATSVGGKCCPIHHSIIVIAAFIVGIAGEGVKSNQSGNNIFSPS